jgi:hypothetical protein
LIASVALRVKIVVSVSPPTNAATRREPVVGVDRVEHRGRLLRRCRRVEVGDPRLEQREVGADVDLLRQLVHG